MSGEKILVVDDEKAVRDVFIAVFFEEYKIIPAANAQQAMDILRRPNDIDLIVLDVMLPDLKGTELLKEIKKTDPRYKVVILTGHSSKEIAIEALRSGADEYIEKPIDIENVKEIFERLIENKRNDEEEDADIQERKIHQAQRIIKRNLDRAISLQDVSHEISLSPKYFSRLFKEKTGQSFSQYKIALRIEMAKDLLRKKTCSVSQIAYQVGYQEPESFMKAFKRLTQLTPSQYRRSKN